MKIIFQFSQGPFFFKIPFLNFFLHISCIWWTLGHVMVFFLLLFHECFKRILLYKKKFWISCTGLKVRFWQFFMFAKWRFWTRAHHITTCHLRFSNLPSALHSAFSTVVYKEDLCTLLDFKSFTLKMITLNLHFFI